MAKDKLTAEFNAAVVGQGPLLEELVHLFRTTPLGEHNSRLNLSALCPREGDRQGLDPNLSYDECLAELTSRPDINVIFVVGDDAAHAKMKSLLNGHALLLDDQVAELFLTVIDPDHICQECVVDLDHTRSLLETIIDQLREDVLLLDKEGRIVDVNRNVYIRRDKTKADFIGYFVWEALDEEENLCRPPEYDCPLSKTIHTKKAAEALYTRVDDQGRMRYYRVYTYPILDKKGDLTHVAEIRRDISQRTNMEQRLQQSERLAAIGELSTYIAHEIRNPLFAISGFANTLLRNKSLDSQAREKVGIILEESARLDQILKSILNFTRPTTAKAGEVDLNKLVEETMGVMRFACDSRNIKINLDLAPELAKAKGDTELVKQAFINIVKNAVEAMPEGGGFTVKTSQGRDYISVAAEDTGVGIPPENLPKVFNPFFSTKDKGGGLGLAMIKKIIDDLGGKVTLSSNLGQGTTVTLSLPPLPADK